MENPASGYYDWHVNRGATLSKSFVWKHSDGSFHNVTGYSGRMKVRKAYNTDPVLSLTTEITFGTTNGLINVDVSAAVMANVGDQNGTVSYKYDLEVIDGDGAVTRLLEGRFIVHPEVTY